MAYKLFFFIMEFYKGIIGKRPHSCNSFLKLSLYVKSLIIQSIPMHPKHSVIKGLSDSPPAESLCCVLEQDTLSAT